jgi:hypothetical protein
MVRREVAVEKVGFSEKSRKSDDRKCSGDWEKSFVELPDAIQFLQIPSERVFQQPQNFSTPIRFQTVFLALVIDPSSVRPTICFGQLI